MTFPSLSENHGTHYERGIALPPRPWQGPPPISPARWGERPGISISVAPDGSTRIEADGVPQEVLRALGGHPSRYEESWRWMTPGVALAVWPLLSEQMREELGIDNACKGRKSAPGAPVVFAVRKSVERIGAHILREPLENGYACLISSGQRALLRAAGWFYHSASGLWHARTLHNAAALGAYAEALVRDRLRQRAIPSTLIRELRHAPALIPWNAKEWRLIANTTTHAGFRPPRGQWRGGQGGHWKTKSTRTAAHAVEFAPKSLARWLVDGSSTHALDGINAGTFILSCPEAAPAGRGGQPGRPPAKPLVRCAKCKEIAFLAPLAQDERFEICRSDGCAAGEDNDGREIVRTPDTLARKGLELATALRLRDRGLATSAAWREIGWRCAAIDIEANRCPTPSRSEIAALVPKERTLRAEQEAAIAHALSHRVSINAAVTGAGKTVVASLVLNALHDTPEKRSAVVVRASLVENWERELGIWLNPGIERTIGRNENTVLPRGGVAVCSYERMQRWPALHAWAARGELSIVVADEGQAAKNPARQRTRALMALPTERRLVLSATPITNRLADVQPMLAAVSPAAFSNASGFGKAYRIRDVRAPTLQEDAMAQDLGERLRESGILFRPDPDRVLADLPPMLPERTVVIDIEGGQEIGAREAELEVQRTTETNAQERIGVLAELARLREAIGQAKVRAMEAELDALKGMQALVFAHHQSVVEGLGRALQKRNRTTELVYGARNQRQRNDAVAAFAAGSVDILVVSMGAGGEGLNMPRAQRVLITELDWGPVPFAQAIGRAHRPGRTGRLEVRYIVARDTLDVHMAETVVGKANTIAQALGDASPQALPQGITQSEERGDQPS